MRPSAIVRRGAEGEPIAEGRGTVQYPEPRPQQVCIADENVNEGPKSIGQIRRQLPEKSEGMDNLVSAGMPPRRQSSHSSDEAGQHSWSEGEQNTREIDGLTRGQDLT